MPRLTVAMFPEHEALVERLVASGRYEDPSDVVLHALSLLENYEIAREHKLKKLKEKIGEGLADVEAGRTVPAEDVFDELYRLTEARRRQDAAE